MIRKNINTVIGKIVKKYFSGHYTASCSVFTDLKSAIEGVDIDEKTMSHLQRLLQIFFSGKYLTSTPLTVFLYTLALRMDTKKLIIKIYVKV